VAELISICRRQILLCFFRVQAQAQLSIAKSRAGFRRAAEVAWRFAFECEPHVYHDDRPCVPAIRDSLSDAAQSADFFRFDAGMVTSLFNDFGSSLVLALNTPQPLPLAGGTNSIP
jgi:hypothetical protein